MAMHTRTIDGHKLSYESSKYTRDDERYMVLKSGKVWMEASDLKTIIYEIAQDQRRETPTIFGQLPDYQIVRFVSVECISKPIKSDRPIVIPGLREEYQPKW